jgi:23S rRNA (uracil1939-C5)-methyltransferase
MSAPETPSPARPSPVRKPARGDVLEVVLDEIDDRGRTLGRHEEFTVAVRSGVPVGGILGSRVRVRIRKRRRQGIEADVEEVLAPSPHAATPRCRHVASCGGCSFQALDYPAQLAAKERLLARILAPLDVAERIAPVRGCATPWAYRNKMDFTYGSERWIEPGEPEGAERAFALGLHARGHFQKVLDVLACEIAFDGAARILADARELARTQGLSAWDVRARRGLLRHLVLRRSWASGELLGGLVTTEAAPEEVGPYAEALLARHPELTTFVQHVHPGVALVAGGTLERVFRGSGTIEDRLGGLAFSISAHGFFQTNTPQAEELVRLVREWAAPSLSPSPSMGATVYDLYCGCGVFALALAQSAGPGNVVGFELSESSIVDARANAARNGLDAVRFVAGDLAVTLAPDALALRGLPRPDLCVIDPPRAGMHASVHASLRVLEPQRIVYVSCNPRSALEDLLALTGAGWHVVRGQPVDLFPHTPHLECVFLLER